jgi:hypothetical protein
MRQCLKNASGRKKAQEAQNEKPKPFYSLCDFCASLRQNVVYELLAERVMTAIVRIFILVLLLGTAVPARALEIDPRVPPEINFGGKMLVTADFLREDPLTGTAKNYYDLNLSDSSLLFGFSKYLFTDNEYGFAVFGIKLPDDDTDLRDDVFLHQAHAGIGGKRYEILLGRTRLTNTLISFPTVRDEDLLPYTHVANGGSNARADEYQIFGGLVKATYWVRPRWMIGGALTARTETDPADLVNNPRKSGSDFNGGSATVAYDIPEAMKAGRGLRFAGVTVDYQRVNAMGSAPKDSKTVFVAGLTFNVSDNPEKTLVLDLQLIADQGAHVPALRSRFEQNRAGSTAIASALRYGHRPWLQTRWFAGLAAGWKKYVDFDDAVSFALAPHWLYRLGSGVDLTAQYVYRKNRGALAAAAGVEAEHEVVVGLSFAFDATINESVGETRSILGLEHNMSDIGPAGGGH